jgi:hypothetical protein
MACTASRLSVYGVHCLSPISLSRVPLPLASILRLCEAGYGVYHSLSRVSVPSISCTSAYLRAQAHIARQTLLKRHLLATLLKRHLHQLLRRGE